MNDNSIMNRVLKIIKEHSGVTLSELALAVYSLDGQAERSSIMVVISNLRRKGYNIKHDVVQLGGYRFIGYKDLLEDFKKEHPK